METLETIRSRKSVRAFLPKPVPKALIAQVLDVARWAPSASNRQPWRVTVVTGPKRQELADQLAERALKRRPQSGGRAGPAADANQTVNTLRAGLSQIAQSVGQSFWDFVVLGSYRLFDAPVAVYTQPVISRTAFVPARGRRVSKGTVRARLGVS